MRGLGGVATIFRIDSGIVRANDPVLNRNNCMAHLWMKDQSEQWAVVPLDGKAYRLIGNSIETLRAADEERSIVSAPLLLRPGEPDQGGWALIATAESEVFVNGLPLIVGLRLLDDTDQIRVGDCNYFYSTETLACIEPMPAASQRLFCVRCKQGIEEGSPAVKCPQCGLWCHQSDQLPCWSYSETCAMCSQPTRLDADYRWTPEDL